MVQDQPISKLPLCGNFQQGVTLIEHENSQA